MSVKMSHLVWKNAACGGGKLLVLLALADFSDDDGVSWPSVKTLAQKARLSERQVQYVVAELFRAKALAVTMNGGPHGSNLYQIRGDKLAGVQILRGGAVCDAGGEVDCTGGVQFDAKGGEVDCTLTVIEPSIEPSIKPPGYLAKRRKALTR